MAPLKMEFKETQKFTQWWLWLILLLAFLSPFIINFKSILEQGFQGTFSKGIFAHIITLSVVIILFISWKLKTKIDKNGIEVHLFPFFKKHFAWNEIKETRLIKYSIWQTGGWGIRWSRLGIIYNIKGNSGVRIKLKNKKTPYIIGTQQPKELQQAIEANTSAHQPIN